MHAYLHTTLLMHVYMHIHTHCKIIFYSFYTSNHRIPGLLDFLKSYSKLCRTLADEICIKYTVELSDLGLVDINMDDNNVEIKVTEEKPSNGMNDYVLIVICFHCTAVSV